MHAFVTPTRYRTWLSGFREVVTLDLRSLALLRMALALIVLYDVADRMRDLPAMYTEHGFVPRAAVLESYGGRPHWPLLPPVGGTWAAAAFFIAIAVTAGAFLLGLWTRLAALLLWGLIASLQAGAPILANGGDALLRALLLWSVFLPLGAMWSLDARRRPPTQRLQVYSVGTSALVLQMAMIYLLAGLFKLNEHWLSGEAIQFALAFEAYGRPIGAWLRQFPGLLAILTRAALTLELLTPLLLLIPWRNAWWRIFACGAVLAMHLGIELTISVGLFSYVCAAGWLALLPPLFWQWAPARRFEEWLSRMFSAAPGAPSFTGVETAGKPLTRATRFEPAAQAICLVLLVLVVTANVESLPVVGRGRLLPEPVERLTHNAMLAQRWAMFASPLRLNLWYRAEARLADGRRVDLLRHGEVLTASDPIPPDVGDLRNHRWRKFFLNLRSPRFSAFRQPLAEWLVRQWNAARPAEQRVIDLELVLIEQAITPTAPSGEFTHTVLARVREEEHEESGNFAEALRRLNEHGKEFPWP